MAVKPSFPRIRVSVITFYPKCTQWFSLFLKIAVPWLIIMEPSKLLLKASNAWNFMSQTFKIIVKWTAYAAVGSHILWNVACKVGGGVSSSKFSTFTYFASGNSAFSSSRSKFNIGNDPIAFFLIFLFHSFSFLRNLSNSLVA